MNSNTGSLVAQLTALGYTVRPLPGAQGCEVSRGGRIEFSGTAAQCRTWMGYSGASLLVADPIRAAIASEGRCRRY